MRGYMLEPDALADHAERHTATRTASVYFPLTPTLVARTFGKQLDALVTASLDMSKSSISVSPIMYNNPIIILWS